jgi:hypothetical protein
VIPFPFQAGGTGLVGGTVAAGPWTPASLSPFFWANDESAVTESGGVLQQWDDVRSNGLSFSQATAGNRPDLNATGLNGRRTVEFTATDYMDGSAGMLAVANGTGFVGCFAVYQNRSSAATERWVLSVALNSTANGISRFALKSSATGQTDKPTLYARRVDGGSSVQLNAATATGTSWSLVGARCDYTNADGFVDINGGLANASNTSFTSAGNTDSSDSSSVRLAMRSGSVAVPYADMNLAEIVIVKGTMPSSSDLDKLYGYFAHRWGLTALLDVAHPYKSVAP